MQAPVSGNCDQRTPPKTGRLFGSEALAKHPPAQSEMTTSLKKHDTGFPADAVEFCPHLLAQDILTCGTYKLLEERDHTDKQQRIGRCSFFSVSNDGDLCDSRQRSLECTLIQFVGIFFKRSHYQPFQISNGRASVERGSH